MSPNQELPRLLLYKFQYDVLPEAAFNNHPELLRNLQGEYSGPPLRHFHSIARVRCEAQGWIPPMDEVSDEELDAEMDLFRVVEIHIHRFDGYTAYVISMPQPEFVPEAHFVAIVHRDGERQVPQVMSPSMRFFTLEFSADGLTCFCEIYPDGSRFNFGDDYDPSEATFVAAIFAQLAMDEE